MAKSREESMSEQLPEFESDDELETWFEEVDLTQYELEEAVEVQIGKNVNLVLEDPWVITESESAATTTSGQIDSSELVPA
jgi:hypothetical protein